MATLAALLKSSGYDVRGSDQNVYPPMSDFLLQQGITHAPGLQRRAHHRRARSRRRRQCDLARQPGARRGARSQDPLLFATRGGPRSFSLGRRGRSSSPEPMARRRRRRWPGGCWRTAAPIRACSLAASRENFESSYRIGGGRDFVIEGDEYDSAFFDKTAKFLKYLPDIAVVNNIEFDHADIYPDLDAIRLAFRRLVNLVPRRGLLLLGADNADAARAQGARALQGRNVRPVEWRRLAGARSRRSALRRRVRRAARRGDRWHIRAAAARRLQRAQRARRDRGGRRGRA